MPPVFGPRSPSKTRLWSCAEASGSDLLAIDETEKTRFLAFEEFLDDDRRIAAHCEYFIEGAERLVHRHRHDDTLARMQAVGLQHDRRTLVADILARGFRIAELGEARGRNLVVGADVLRKALRAFELRGLCRRSENFDAGRFEMVG